MFISIAMPHYYISDFHAFKYLINNKALFKNKDNSSITNNITEYLFNLHYFFKDDNAYKYINSKYLYKISPAKI